MSSARLMRRLAVHHAVLAAITAITVGLVYVLAPGADPVFRLSMTTAYLGLALLGASLLTGPLNLLRGRANPVSTDLRRDIGIWAGLVSLVHFVVGLQVHMKYRYMYWLDRAADTQRFSPRMDPFGVANHLGLLAVVITLLLLALSNDWSLRRLRRVRWKRWQRWNYWLFALVAAHGVAYQLMERRMLAFVALFGVMLLIVCVAQWRGMLAYRARRNDVARSSDA